MKAASLLSTASLLALLFVSSSVAQQFKRAIAPTTAGKVTMAYNSKTGDVKVQADEGVKLTTIEIKSAAGLFIPDNALEGSKPGLFDVVNDSKVFKLDPAGFQEVKYGPILPKGLTFAKLRDDMTVAGSIQKGGLPEALLYVWPSRPVDDDGTWVAEEFGKILLSLKQLQDRSDDDVRKIEKLLSDLKQEYDQNSRKLAPDEPKVPSSERQALLARQTTIRLYLPEIRRLGTMLFLQDQQSVQRILQDLKTFKEIHLSPGDDGKVSADVADLTQPLEAIVEKITASLNEDPPFGVTRNQLADLIRGDQLDHTGVDDVLPDDDRYANRRSDLVEGKIQELRAPMRMLFRLAWRGERLTIDKHHWRILFGDKSRQAVIAEVKALMRSRDITLPQFEGLQRPKENGEDFCPSVTRLFENLKAKAGARGGRTSRGTEGYHAEFRANDVTGMIQFNRESFSLRVVETDAPSRVLSIREDTSGALRVVLAGDVVLRLKQEANGHVTVVEITEDDVRRHTATNFASLYREKPEYVENQLFPLLSHMCVAVPTSRDDKQVVRRIVQRIQLNQTSDQISLDGLDSLIDALGLLNDRSYLSEIIPMLDEQDGESVRNHVRRLADRSAASSSHEP